MPDKWAKYAQPSTPQSGADKWAQYAVQPQTEIAPPPTTAPATTPDVPFYKKAWDAITSPVGTNPLDVFSGAQPHAPNMGGNSGQVTAYQENKNNPTPRQVAGSYAASPPTLDDANNPFMTGVKKGAASTLTDTTDAAMSLYSPLSLATGTMSQGAGALPKFGTRAVGTLFGIKGAGDVIGAGTKTTPEAWQQRLQGGAMMAGGAAGNLQNRQFANAPIAEAPSRLTNDFVEGVKRKLLPGSPESLLVTATKPTVGLPDYENSLSAAMPPLAAQNPTNLTELTNAADRIKTDTNATYQGLKQRAGNAPVPTYSVARAQNDSIPATNLFEDPSIVSKTNAKSSRYQTTMPIEQADALRLDTNGKLREFFNKSGGDKYAALSNPETARIAAVNDGVRSQLYDTIQQATGVDPRPIQDMYGHAVDIGDTAGHRNTVFSRRQPGGLNEIVNNASSPMSWLAGKVIKGVNDNNRQVKWAFDRYANQQQPTYRPSANPGSMIAALIQSWQKQKK